jgi:3-dehydroquinate synthase
LETLRPTIGLKIPENPMEIVDIPGRTGQSTVLIGEVLSRLDRYVNGSQAVIITDSNVRRCHDPDFPPYDVVEIPAGEAMKNLDTVRFIYDRLRGHGIDRNAFIVGIGGGVVCDITGFVASTYLRGVPFGFVSSSLLAQVDASVGGKNGVNVDGYKNMVGVIKQPEFVICDLNLLKTLPEKEIRCGLAEIVKHGAVGSSTLFEYLEDRFASALALDPRVMERLVHESVLVKSTIVQRDELEHGVRRKLNFGHTLGHAVERAAGLAHGEAVAVGMVKAAAFSVEKGYLSLPEAKRIEKLLERLGLPTNLPCHKDDLWDAMAKDKKRQGDRIHFVFLKALGQAFVEAIPLSEIETFLETG